MSPFQVQVHQNQYLPVGGDVVDAIVTVDSFGLAVNTQTAAHAAEVIIVDISGSMDSPRAKLLAAKDATAAAIDCLRDGVEFAVVVGADNAEVIFPKRGLAVADDESRAEAKRTVRKLRAGGGTAIGRWLRAADALFERVPDAIHHAILLTDGQNVGQKPEELAVDVARCVDRFQCDCRGVGADWDVDELRGIASSLLGSVDIIPDPADMVADFTTMMQQSMGKAISGAALRVWTPKGAHVEFVKQVQPSVEDLSARRTDVSERIGEYPTGAWGDECRDYHLRIRVTPQDAGAEMLAGRVQLVVDGETTTEAKILVVWTPDEALSTKINAAVAQATDQAELADAIQRGIKAWELGDVDTATTHLGRAVQLAHEAGDVVRLEQLERIVVTDDAATGIVRVRPDASRLDRMTVDTQSTKTVLRVPDASKGDARPT